MGVRFRSKAYLLPLIFSATISMGNESCEADKSPRVLRLDVEVGRLAARSVRLPNGETVDFPTVANSLFYGQVMNNRHFVTTNSVPLPAPAGGLQKLSSKSSAFSASARDVELLAKFGFARTASARSETRTLEKTAALPATCLYESPLALLSGDVVSFEAGYGGGLRVGYGADGQGLPPGAGGSVRFESTKLDMRLRSDDPLSRQAVTIGDGVAHDTRVDFAVDFVAGVPIGLDFFYKTALSDVVKKAMDRALGQVVDRYKAQAGGEKSWDDVWETRLIYDPVIADNDTHIAIRAGQRANVQTGDKFYVTNMRYAWEGAECASRLKYRIPISATPALQAEVVSVGNNVAVARVIELYIEEAILPGAQVKIATLRGNPKK